MKSFEYLKILREISKNPFSNQRTLAKDLELSLGKINFIIKSLKKKGLIKIKNFNKSNNKLKYTYILTAQGLSSKTKLTIAYLKKISKEYEDLQKELPKINENKKNDSI